MCCMVLVTHCMLCSTPPGYNVEQTVPTDMYLQVAAAHPVVFDSDEELDSVDQVVSMLSCTMACSVALAFMKLT